MNSWKRMEEFEAVSLENQKIGTYIRKQNPFLYEEEYGKAFPYYTDQDLMDLFICKFRHYKPSVMSAVFGKYRRFYGFLPSTMHAFLCPDRAILTGQAANKISLLRTKTTQLLYNICFWSL